jgi:hypothetical protein
LAGNYHFINIRSNSPCGSIAGGRLAHRPDEPADTAGGGASAVHRARPKAAGAVRCRLSGLATGIDQRPSRIAGDADVIAGAGHFFRFFPNGVLTT